MAIEQNKRLAIRIFEIFPEVADSGAVDALDEVMTPDVKVHGTAGDFGSRAEFKEAVRSLAQQMGRTTIDVHNIVAEGDFVVALYTHSASFAMDFQGMAAAGKTVRFTGTMVYRIEDGKVAEAWIHEDIPRMLAQLGASPVGA